MPVKEASFATDRIRNSYGHAPVAWGRGLPVEGQARSGLLPPSYLFGFGRAPRGVSHCAGMTVAVLGLLSILFFGSSRHFGGFLVSFFKMLTVNAAFSARAIDGSYFLRRDFCLGGLHNGIGWRLCTVDRATGGRGQSRFLLVRCHCMKSA